MRICGVCRSEIPDDAIICPACGCAVPREKKPDEAPPVWMRFLALMFPIVGFILWATWRRERPKRALTISYWGLAGLVLWGLLTYLIASAAA